MKLIEISELKKGYEKFNYLPTRSAFMREVGGQIYCCPLTMAIILLGEEVEKRNSEIIRTLIASHFGWDYSRGFMAAIDFGEFNGEIIMELKEAMGDFSIGHRDGMVVRKALKIQ